MNKNSRQFLKSLILPILLNTIRSANNDKYGWKGNYKTWQDAQNDSTGYDTDKILQTVKNSLLKVKSGEVVYERDSVIFDEIQYSWQLLSGLMFCSARTGGTQGV